MWSRIYNIHEKIRDNFSELCKSKALLNCFTRKIISYKSNLKSIIYLILFLIKTSAELKKKSKLGYKLCLGDFLGYVWLN